VARQGRAERTGGEHGVTSHRTSVVSWIRLVLALALLTSLIALVPAPAATAGGAFVDDDDSVHEPYIEAFAAAGITNGCNPPVNDRFCPDRPVTRGEMAAFLVRALSLPSTSWDSFRDDEDSIFEDAINALAAAGITNGCNPPTNTHYCPDDAVTRGQMAALLVRAFDYDNPGVGDWFSDDDTSIFEADIDRIRQAGITVGCNPPANTHYCPNNAVTREQMATFLVRALDLDPVNPPTPTPPPPDLDPLPTHYDVTFHAGDNVAAAVASHRSGTSYYFAAGVYRMQEITPKNGDVFVGAPGAVLSGAKRLTTFSKEGSLWVASGQTQQHSGVSQGDEYGRCENGYDGCIYPEDVFIDDVALLQVTSKSQVVSGKFYFDYGADKIYIADNPSGHVVEASVTEHAFTGAADDVRIEGFIIEKYATPGREGAVNARIGRVGANGVNWIVANNEIRLNHGYAVKVEVNMIVQGNDLHDNGHMALGTVADNVQIQNNEIAYNCRAGYRCMGWSSGGIKLDFSDNVVIRWNNVHHNLGHGIMVDCGSRNATIEHNTVYDNEGIGIQHEISSTAKIYANDIRRNGFPIPGPGTESINFPGILILDSEDSEVYQNTLIDNNDAIIARQDSRLPAPGNSLCEGIYDLRNVYVHDNYMDLTNGATVGIDLDWGVSDTAYFTSRNNRFRNNDYLISSPGSKRFRWFSSQYGFQEELVNAASWVAAGQDTGGSFTYP
jgi:parallel beta-helix repeat protein